MSQPDKWYESRTLTTTLTDALRQTMSDAMILYYAVHVAHWNVEGPLFESLHAFFDKMQDDVFDSIDPFAESIRQHGELAPVSMGALVQMSSIRSQPETGDTKVLLRFVLAGNSTMMETLLATKNAADAAGDLGLSNFCQDRLAAHLKYDWQLKALLK